MVTAWARPAGGYEHFMSAQIFTWLVRLKFPDGLARVDGWCCFEPQYLRPV
jgi:hypothetical protein